MNRLRSSYDTPKSTKPKSKSKTATGSNANASASASVRDRIVLIRVNAKEHNKLTKSAMLSGIKLSTYVRETALKGCK